MSGKLGEAIASSDRIVFFGGAGVSTESGIPDFRSAQGLYSQESGFSYAPEQIISHSFFMEHPKEFFQYYRKHLVYPRAMPNPAHYALASLEKAGKLSAVVTQNIDGLHQQAGSKRVFELHGNVHRNTCMECGKKFGLDSVLAVQAIPKCDECGGIIKPDVVLYEEPLDEAVWDQAVSSIASADTLIVGGTSLSVYPAASLVQAFRGESLVLINRDETPYDQVATLIIRKPIGQTLAEYA